MSAFRPFVWSLVLTLGAGCAHSAPTPQAQSRPGVRLPQPRFAPFVAKEQPRSRSTQRPTFVQFSLWNAHAARSALEVRNETEWDVALQLENVGTTSGRILGIVRAGATVTFERLPSEEWVAFYAVTGDGKLQLRRPGVPLGIDETQQWVLRPSSGWDTIAR